MLRRQARLKREFLRRKATEQRDYALVEKKRKLREALDSHTAIDGTLREEALDIEDALDWDDQGADQDNDDEYRFAGVEDPKILLSTSRSPSSRLKQFAKELKLVFPNCQRINRGNYDIQQVVHACKANSVTDLIFLHEHRGQPDGLIVSHLPFGPTAYFTLHNVVMRHDLQDAPEKVSEAYPHLIFENLSGKLGNRVKDVLKYLFPVPKEESKRVITFSNEDDFISFRHHIYKKVEGRVNLTELGPRFQAQLFKIILGTIADEAFAEVEWVYRPYTNTARKKEYLVESKREEEGGVLDNI